MIIAIDFDGTLCEHVFPRIGPEVPNALATLKRLQKAGHKLILWTMRSDKRADGTNPLHEAVEWCRKMGVEFWAVNANPEQREWTESPKAYAQLYIDDAAFGCPLTPGTIPNGRPMVNWYVVARRLAKIGIIKKEPRYAYLKRHYLRQTEKGLCHRCGTKPLYTSTACLSCRNKQNARMKARYQERKVKPQPSKEAL